MRGLRHVWLLAAAAAVAAAPVRAGDTYWRHDPASPGDWFDDANWTGGAPGSSDSAYINNGGTAEIASGFAKADLLYLGQTNGTDGTVTLGGAGKLGTGHEYVGHAGEGEIDQSGGTHGVGGVLYLGHDATGHGTYILSSGDLDADWLFVGHEGTGEIDQSGGTHGVGGAAAGRIRLVDDSLNHKPACTEAMYVETIVMNRGAVIDLNGLSLYFLHDGQPRRFYHGDASLDGCVDGADYTAWADHYGLTYMSWGEGDFSGDECVDGADYTAWADNYGSGCGSGATVPEPACAALIASGLLALARRRRT